MHGRFKTREAGPTAVQWITKWAQSLWMVRWESWTEENRRERRGERLPNLHPINSHLPPSLPLATCLLALLITVGPLQPETVHRLVSSPRWTVMACRLARGAKAYGTYRDSINNKWCFFLFLDLVYSLGLLQLFHNITVITTHFASMN